MKKNKRLNIQKRIVSGSGHTLGYVIGGKQYTRLQTVKLVRQGKVSTAKAMSLPVPHIRGISKRLYSLPVKMAKRNNQGRIVNI